MNWVIKINHKQFLILYLAFKIQCIENLYRIGVGIGDVTGPAAEINMMGYAKSGQDTSGIHFRLYSRAVIIDDGKGGRVCFVSCDLAMISQIIKLEVIKILEQRFNGLYNINNVMLSSTHTHSGPGGFFQYLLYNIPSLGFINQNFEAIRDGIIRSIVRAHSGMTSGTIFINSGQIFNTSVNRSPTAYENNPQNERNRYKDNIDTRMTVLKMIDTNGRSLGAITWFAVHCTSMNNTNTLISGDNKGLASMLFELDINGVTQMGKGPFVALFPNSNEGDVSPNTRGPKCADTGLPCDVITSTCNGDTQKCVASGPGKDMFESTKIIGTRQYRFAKELFLNAKQQVLGSVEFIHQNIDIENTIVVLPNKTTVKTCKAAMGFSFAAGTTDGPGVFPFNQGETTNRLWNLLNRYVMKANQELIDCQYPKPILLATGQMKFPEPWQPSILPTQILKIGQLLIVSVPSELTTMAGRRLREVVKSEYEMHSSNSSDVEVVISGLANTYSSYVTTFEEYQSQRYEGASTLYGPYTLHAYLQQYKLLANHFARHQPIDSGPQEPNYLERQISLKPGVLLDCAPFGMNFGDVITEPQEEYSPGAQVKVSFVSGNPRNDVRDESTFLVVEKLIPHSMKWQIIATDSNWETKFYWKRIGFKLISCESLVTIIWDIPEDTVPGIYRIRHFGNYRDWTQQIYSYSGVCVDKSNIS